MRTDTLRMLVGFSFIFSHLLSFGLILFGGLSAFAVDERVELSLLISPIFGIYVTAIVRKITSQMQSPYDSVRAHPSFVTLAIGTALIFSLAIPMVIFMFLAGRIATFSVLKSYLGIIETAIGVYTGGVISALFGGVPPSTVVERR